MALEHSTLTGAQLHEPKGVATAADGAVYVADGAGSGAWTPIIATPSYAEMYITANASPFSCAASATFEKLKNTNWSAGASSGITITADDVNDDLTLDKTGAYIVTFWTTLSTALADGGTITFRYALDGATNGREMVVQKNSTGTDYITASATGILTASLNQKLSIFVATSDHTTPFTIVDAGLSAVRIA